MNKKDDDRQDDAGREGQAREPETTAPVPSALLDAIERAWLGRTEKTMTSSWDVGTLLADEDETGTCAAKPLSASEAKSAGGTDSALEITDADGRPHGSSPSSSSPPWSDRTTTIAAMRQALIAFNRARDWERFHTPAALAQALIVEAAELLELFLWTGGEPGSRPNPAPEEMEAEAADVGICLINFCRRVGIDLSAAIQKKMKANGAKYPVAASRARALKYSELKADRARGPDAGARAHSRGDRPAAPDSWPGGDEADPAEATLSAFERTPVRRRR